MRISLYFIAIFILVLSGDHALAQGSGSSRSSAPRSSPAPDRYNSAVPATPKPPTHAQFAASFWGHLKNDKGSYRQWGSPGKNRSSGESLEIEGAAGGKAPSEMPHKEVGQTYLNHTANMALQKLPLKSVLVREAYAADDLTLENITVMYRSKGVDPENGDWYWIMYLPNGSLASTSPEQGNRPIAGRVPSCVQCHRQAAGNDYVFLNDGPAPGARPSNPHGRAQGVPQADPDGSGSRR